MYVRRYYTDAAALNPFLAQPLPRSGRRSGHSERGGQPAIGAAVPLRGWAEAEVFCFMPGNTYFYITEKYFMFDLSIQCIFSEIIVCSSESGNGLDRSKLIVVHFILPVKIG